MRQLIVPTIFCAAMLTGCAQAPLGPTLAVTPGPGKSDVVFRADQDACRTFASQSIAGQMQAANGNAVAGALNGVLAATSGDVSGVASAGANGAVDKANAQVGMQQQYDATYGQCMYSRNNVVPGMEPPTAVVEAVPDEGPVRDPLVRKVQLQLGRLGYLHASADGIAGKKTAAAINAYETDHNLTLDGVASHNLLASLQSQPSVAAASATATPPTAGWAVPPPPAADATASK